MLGREAPIVVICLPSYNVDEVHSNFLEWFEGLRLLFLTLSSLAIPKSDGAGAWSNGA